MSDKQILLSSAVCQDEIKLTEYTTIKASFEYLKKRHRGSQRVLEREFSNITKSIDEYKKVTDKNDTKDQYKRFIDDFTNLKRKAETFISEELKYTKACKLRLNHLFNLSEGKQPVVTNIDSMLTKKIEPHVTERFQRHLADHLFARGMCQTALHLGKSIECTGDLEGSKDPDLHLGLVEIYKESLDVIDALKKGDTGPADAWLHLAQYKTKRGKLKHTFQTDLQIFKVYRHVKMGDYEKAIKYAQTISDPKLISESTLEKLSQVMTLMVVRSQEEMIQTANEWEVDEDWIIRQFHSCVLQFYSFYQEPTLMSLILNTGISVHKTEDCYRKESKKLACVVCNEPVNTISTHIPTAKYDHSILVCWKTGMRMNDSNPPIAFPNGYVYSSKAIEEMMEEDETVVCPRSNLRCKQADLRKVFVV